ncbi:hypothetical protein H6F67_19840 [Microcoleus sp. FACHB-1515]|uniref:hypothetical protein n=1 Tax=Cyanophyceae TaxID=3028117 RepID=UPI001685CFD8|nr:hypothetical protein [Microcoleus sp. FACHB-1515]MBD2092104.1 hypothetical protein [Microcoleus sp. FACHB-1515]
MTQANLLEQAKSGDPSAIAALMNRTLKPKGITATVGRLGDRLLVYLEAAQVPNRQAMTTFVQNGILGLKTQTIREIEIHGKQTGDDRSVWVQEILLGMVVDRAVGQEGDRAAVQEVASASPISDPPTAPTPPPPPPPPLRPAPPPIPRMQPPDPIASVDTPVASPDPIESEVVAPIEPLPASQPSPMLQAAIPPGEEIVTARRPRRQSGLLLPLVVLALLSALIGAIVGYALWRDRTAPNPEPILPPSSPTPTAAAPTPASPAPTPASPTSANPLEDAIAKQTQAQALAQAAQSADDWSLVASQWQQSIDLLQSIPANSPNYAAAQTRLRQAETQLADAREQASRPIASAPPPNTTFTVTREVRCPTTATGGAPVELSNIRFQSGSEIVGCITNNTNQPIANVSIAYQGTAPTPTEATPPASPAAPPASPAAPPAGNSALNFSELPPQRTVPFSGSIAIDPQVSNVTISGINWTPAGASEAQQLPVSVALTR